MIEIEGKGYRIWSPHPFHEGCSKYGNIDVHVYLQDGTHYVTTMYTVENLREVLELGRLSGECAGGAYTWDTSMIVMRDLSLATIQAVVEDLIQSGYIQRAMDLCTSPPESAHES